MEEPEAVRRKRAAGAVSVIIATVTMCCCGPGDNDDGIAAHSAEANPVAASLADARAASASDLQITILERYAETGEVPYSAVVEAVAHTQECFDDHTIPYTPLEGDLVREHPDVAYTFGVSPSLTEEESYDIAMKCITHESEFVERAYAFSGTVVEQRDSEFAEARPAIIECLVEAGVAASEESTDDELIIAVIELETATTGALPNECIPLLP